MKPHMAKTASAENVIQNAFDLNSSFMSILCPLPNKNLPKSLGFCLVSVEGVSLPLLNFQPRYFLKVPTVARENGLAVAEGNCTDYRVHIADFGAFPLQVIQQSPGFFG